MSALAGTWPLARLALRRDRILLPVWVGSIIGLTVAIAGSVRSLYETTEERVEAARFSATNVATRMINGPASGTDIGSLILFEVYATLAILVALMSAQVVVRHTRQNEETGRAELLGSAAAGRHAPLTAALVVALGADLLIAAGLSGVLAAQGLDLAGSLGAGASLGALGLVFAGIGAVAAQVMSTQRGATAVSTAALGAAYLLRGAGDALGDVAPDRVVLVSAWPSWLSPVGWGQQVRPFHQANWEVFSVFLAALVALVTSAYVLAAGRDVGAGMIAVRPGPASAAASLRSPLALAWRLHRGLLLGWIIAMAAVGAAFGAIGDSVDNVLGISEQFEQLILRGSGDASLAEQYFTFVAGFLGIAAAGYTIQALLRARGEESAGHAEATLATAVSRTRWLASHIVVAAAGTLAVLLALGASGAVAYAAVTGDPADALGMLTAALAQVPAAYALGGLVVAAFALVPRGVAALAWTALAASLVMGQLGELFELPQPVLNLSPFTHTPAVPTEAPTATPVMVLIVSAVALTGFGAVWFRHRDLAIGA